MKWISTKDKLPKLLKMLDEPMTVGGRSIPTMYVSVDVLTVKNGEISVGAVEWFDNG